MFKVLFWDIDGTLLNFHAAEAVAIRTLFEKFEFGVCTDEMLDDYKKINRKYWQALERGEIEKPQVLVGRFQEFFGKYELDTERASEFNSAYQLALGDTIAFYDGAYELIEELRGKVLQCAVTNGTKVAQDKKLRLSGLGELFDHVFISDVIGVEKPNVEFFDAVWAEIGDVPRDECLIIGDSLTSDMKGGVNVGIKTCWFNPDGAENNSDLQLDYEIKTLKEVKDIIETA